MAFWLRGGGVLEQDAGLAMYTPWRDGQLKVAVETLTRDGSSDDIDVDMPSVLDAAASEVRHTFVSEVEFRELFHTHAGGYDSVVQLEGQQKWLEAMAPGMTVEQSDPLHANNLRGRNTLCLLVEPRVVRETWCSMRELDGEMGSRLTVLARGQTAAWLRSQGAVYLRGVKTSRGKFEAYAGGKRSVCGQGCCMDYEMLRAHMDPRDNGDEPANPDAKQDLIWSQIPWDSERWRDKGWPPEVEKLMTNGAQVPEPPGDRAYREFGQYPWDADEALMAGISEADRAITVGAMEYVPESQLESVLNDGMVHPWTMAQKGDKWRACFVFSGLHFTRMSRFIQAGYQSICSGASLRAAVSLGRGEYVACGSVDGQV